MVNMRHSFEQAVEIQKKFEKEYTNAGGVVGIGIGLNKKSDDLAISVQVARESAVRDIPDTFGGIDVVVAVVGTVKAM